MNRTVATGAVVGAAALALLAADSLYVVPQGRLAVLMRLEAPVRVVGDAAPGLYLKWPLIERAAEVDARLQGLAAASRPVRAADGTRLDLDAALAYRVVDPLAYLRAGGAAAVEARLADLAGEAAATALQGAPAPDILAGRPPAPRLSDALASLRRAAAAQGLGVQIADLTPTGARLSEADAGPAATAEAAALQRQAAQVRADGEAARASTQGEMDRAVAQARGEGEAAVLRARGEGDAERARILGVAYGEDPAFAAYLRRLDAYDAALNPATTTLVLSPDNAFLSTFGRGPPPKEGAHPLAPPVEKRREAMWSPVGPVRGFCAKPTRPVDQGDGRCA